MLDFVFIFLIFLETFLTILCVRKIILVEKKVLVIEKSIATQGNLAIIALKRFRKSLEKINKVIAFLKNKKFLRIKQILTFAFQVAEIVILIRSFKFKKGFKINTKNILKLLYTQAFRKLLQKVFFVLKSCFV